MLNCTKAFKINTRLASIENMFMNIVQPIRDVKTINQVKELLKIRHDKYYMMFVLGLNTGLRISDILPLKVIHLLNQTHINIVEKKTGKAKRFPINTQLQKDIADYVLRNQLTDNQYMIPSRQGENKPITSVQAYRILNSTAKSIGLTEIGCHSMRKTFGYFHYKQHKDLAILQDIFNHSAPSITMKYIGMNQDMIDNSLKDFYL
ncbi:site-specific recombinase [Gammaproteobacteria bacterium]|nr:site-specific recombinase [Gammaproteobacteria bacterium]